MTTWNQKLFIEACDHYDLEYTTEYIDNKVIYIIPPQTNSLAKYVFVEDKTIQIIIENRTLNLIQ